jgi:tRNA modification GTPase
MMIHDTIAAISTPMGEGGIAVIRISGDEALAAADRVFTGKSKLGAVPSHTVHYGFIKHPITQERVDEVLVTVMKAPKTFTTEDVVEISCHGGFVSVKKVLDLLLEQQVRLAEPGEFTKRAYLNGRIDLSQAEAVIDLIRAKSDRAFRVAMKQSEGTLSKNIKLLRHDLVELMAHIEVNIDYPEHDVEEMTNAFITTRCLKAIDQITQLLNTAHQGKILREGIMTAIVGKPNVGKSSLLNTLAQENRAIVTEIPGTTRDVIEEFVTINGIPLQLLDTAGLRETSDIVERIGVEKSKNALNDADLILLVLNGSERLEPDELELIERLKEKQTIVIVNKLDLPQSLEIDILTRYFPAESIVYMSLLEQQGITDLEKAIAAIFFSGQVESNDLTYVSNARHISLLKKANSSLEEAHEAAGAFVPIDLIQIDIRNAWEYLGEIIGDSVGESLIDQIFSQFCLGK